MDKDQKYREHAVFMLDQIKDIGVILQTGGGKLSPNNIDIFKEIHRKIFENKEISIKSKAFRSHYLRVYNIYKNYFERGS